jgi:copper chaperone CopZ
LEGINCEECVKSLNAHINSLTGFETIQLYVEKNGFSNIKSDHKSITFSYSNGPEYSFNYGVDVKFNAENLPERNALIHLFEQIKTFDQQHIQSFLNILKIETSLLRKILQKLNSKGIEILLKVPNDLNLPNSISTEIRIGSQGVQLEGNIFSIIVIFSHNVNYLRSEFL